MVLSSGSVLGFLILNGVNILLLSNGVKIGVGIGVGIRLGIRLGVEIGVGIRLGVEIGVSSGVEIVGSDTFSVGSSLVLIVVIIGCNSICVLIVVIIGCNGICVLIVVLGAGGGVIGVTEVRLLDESGDELNEESGVCGGPGGPGGIINPAGLFTPSAKLSLISFNNFITSSY